MRTVQPVMLAITALIAANNVNAQQTKPAMIEFGVGTGTFIYQGDLVRSPFGTFTTATPNFQFYVAKTLNSSFSVRGNLTMGTIRANESAFTNPSWKQQRNFAFSTRLTEVSAQLVFNPLGTNLGSYTPRLTPYVFGGVGATFTDVSRDYSRTTNAFLSDTKFANGLAIDSAAGTPSLIATLLIGMGVQYRISNTFSAYMETAYRFTTSDYIDGFSRAANAGNKDSYYSLQLGLHIKLFSKQTACPPVKR